jgi:serine/threonine protein kinase
MPAVAQTFACVCGARLEGTPSPAGVLACAGCGRQLVVDARAAALASPADPAADTGPLATSSSAAVPLSHSLLGPALAPGPAPDRIGPYRITGRLGQGGMGVVYRGHDDALDRAVAVKLILPGSEPEAAKRLLREARSVAAISHENVVRVYAAGETDEGAPYLVMELVQGRDLRELLDREGPLPWRRALDLMIQASRGLAAASQRGLVHRDVKPANLLLMEEAGHEPVLKIADFGLAKARAQDASLTASGTIAGTALYVAPEIAREGTGDQRADMYSLGATFFHLLSGRAPFQGKTPAAVIVAHLTEPAPPLARHRPDVPEGLARVIDRLLAKAPEDRFASWDELQQDLARVALGRPPLAAPVPRPVPIESVSVRPRARRREGARRNLAIAYLLALPPFGLFGFHRFYLGKFSTGLLYLPTLGLFGLGWLHDLASMPRLVEEASPPPVTRALDDSEAIASTYMLWFFLGWLGLHRFYAGRIASGMLYFFTLGGFFIGWALDFLAIPAIVREARRQEI